MIRQFIPRRRSHVGEGGGFMNLKTCWRRGGIQTICLVLLLTGASPPSEPPQGDTAGKQQSDSLRSAPPDEQIRSRDADARKRAYQRSDRDLSAEWRTVRATEKAADVALWSLFLGIAGAVITAIGTGLVLLTFRETRRTAQIAEDGLFEARRSANAALPATAGHMSRVRCARPWAASSSQFPRPTFSRAIS